MTDRLEPIAAILEDTAPMTAALATRVSALPPLAKLAAKAKEDYGDAYCGGKIEASLRKVLAEGSLSRQPLLRRRRLAATLRLYMRVTAAAPFSAEPNSIARVMMPWA